MLSPGVLPYGPSKAALEAMTVGWAAQLDGTGVTVNEVLPGGASGERTPEKHWFPDDLPRWPAEIMVPPIRWLASTASDGVTGRRFVARLLDTAPCPRTRPPPRPGFPAGRPLERTTSPSAPARPGAPRHPFRDAQLAEQAGARVDRPACAGRARRAGRRARSPRR